MDAITSMYIAQGMHGLCYGMILFLIASGLTIIFGMMGILNLAHAAFFMLAAYFCYMVLSLTGNFWIALFVAPLLTAAVGMVLERFMLRRVLAYGHIFELIVTLGFAQIILAFVKITWGTETLPVGVPPLLEGMVNLGGLEYPLYRLFVIGLALAVMVLMVIVLYKTRLGKIVRAAVHDKDMVNALGINISVVFTLTFGFGIWLGGIAGVAIAPILTVFPGLADQVGMDAFMVVVTGGFGSLGGAFLVSIIFGLMSSYGVQFISQLAPLLMVVFMAVVLAIRPHGLFGVKE